MESNRILVNVHVQRNGNFFFHSFSLDVISMGRINIELFLFPKVILSKFVDILTGILIPLSRLDISEVKSELIQI